MPKRITLSDRECHVIAKTLAFMTSNASPANNECKCLLEMARDEIAELRERILK